MDDHKPKINENSEGQLCIFSDADPVKGPAVPAAPLSVLYMQPADDADPEEAAAALAKTLSPASSASSAAMDHMDVLSLNQKIMEALLFAVPEPVQLGMLAKACGISRHEASKEITGLKQYLEQTKSGILIKEVDESYELMTNPEYFSNLVSVVSTPKKPELTDIMMETLAIIAEKAPTTRVEIEKIRGVKSDFAVNKLIEYGLIEEKGRLGAPGRPVLFGPTAEFYRRFGIDDDHPMPAVDQAAKEEIQKEAETEAGNILGASSQ